MDSTWKADPPVFYAWCDATCPNKDLTLERIDVNGDYEPGNLTWVTRQEQMYNRRDTIFVTYSNEVVSMARVYDEACDPKPSYNTFRARIKRGWRVDEALQP